jgi:hypothetical protein
MDWTVVHNNGNTADLESGPLGTEGRKSVKRPKKMSRKEFFDSLPPGMNLNDAALHAVLEEK